MTTTVIKTIKTSGGDFAALSAFATWLHTQDLIAQDIAIDCQIFNSQTAANCSYASLQPASGDITRNVTVRPAPGLGVNELETTGADYGTVGIELVINYTNGGVTVGTGVTLTGFRILLSGVLGNQYGILNSGPALGVTTTNIQSSVISRNRIKNICTGNSTYPAILTQGTGQTQQFTDNLCISDSSTTSFIRDGYQADILRNTFVQRNGATGFMCSRAYNPVARLIANLYIDCGATPVDRSIDWTTVSNNFSNTTISGTSTGFTANTGTNAITRGNADSRLTIGTSPAIGAGGSIAMSITDLLNNNRGPVPDAGAIQLTPYAPSPAGAITSITVNGQDVTISGTTAYVPTSGQVSISPGTTPNGAVSVGPKTITLGTNTFTVTLVGMATGNYAVPVITLTNLGGSSGVTGGSTFIIVGVGAGGDAAATAATAIMLSGPSSGTVSAASTNFTVGANGIITGTIIVTLSDGASGGVFTPTTVSISSGTPTATFTYTPSIVGTISFSTSNNGSLANSVPITYSTTSLVSGYLSNGGWSGSLSTSSGVKIGGIWNSISESSKGVKIGGVWTTVY